jgi:hypothetical protein
VRIRIADDDLSSSNLEFDAPTYQNEPLWELKWPLSACLGFAVLRPCSVGAQACSPSDQAKAAAAHVETLKRNQQKKVESDFSGSCSASLKLSISFETPLINTILLIASLLE